MNCNKCQLLNMNYLNICVLHGKVNYKINQGKRMKEIPDACCTKFVMRKNYVIVALLFMCMVYIFVQLYFYIKPFYFTFYNVLLCPFVQILIYSCTSNFDSAWNIRITRFAFPWTLS